MIGTLSNLISNLVEKRVEDCLSSNPTSFVQTPAVAVLPFRPVDSNLGPVISYGVSEEISAFLACLRDNRVISTVSFLDGGTRATDIQERCRQYGVQTVVDGTVKVGAGKVRITVAIMDTKVPCTVLWSELFQASLQALPDLASRISREIAARIEPGVTDTLAAPSGSGSGQIQMHLIRGIHQIMSLDRVAFMQGRSSFLQAIASDRENASAYSWLAYWAVMSFALGWFPNKADAVELAEAAAEIALSKNPHDARALAVAGHIEMFLRTNPRGAIVLLDKAVAANPNLPYAWTCLGWALSYLGRHEEALEHAATAINLSPQDPHIFFPTHLRMLALLLLRQPLATVTVGYENAATSSRHAAAMNLMISALGHLGRLEEAKALLARLSDLNPSGATVTGISSRMHLEPADREYYEEGLRKAGVPE